tara:strand:- start:354 stop:758 length:405 start_codon:yes stop_codon:yes gene_type:complete
MAKQIGKGTILKSTISAMLTAVAQVNSISTSGFASQTFDGTSLDSAVGREMILTGYATPGTCDVELFYSQALAGHAFYITSISTPVNIVHTITYIDTKVMTFTGSGMDFGQTIVMDDGVKATLSITISGLPTWA